MCCTQPYACGAGAVLGGWLTAEGRPAAAVQDGGWSMLALMGVQGGVWSDQDTALLLLQIVLARKLAEPLKQLQVRRLW